MSRTQHLALAVARDQATTYRLPGTRLIARVVRIPTTGEQLDDLYRQRAARYGTLRALSLD